MRPHTPADQWWEALATPPAQTPIGELLAGFEAIADEPIPYSQLPKRARTNFSADYEHWSDLAGVTPRALLSRPKTGKETVRALLTTAREAVARSRSVVAPDASPVDACQRFLDRLDERDRLLLSARVWAHRKRSRAAVAEQLGVHLSWVERNQPRAQARYRDLLADPAHRDLADHAAELRRRLGVYLPSAALTSELCRLGVEASGEAASLLLHLAGPYTCDEQWCENTAAGGRRRLTAAVDAVLDRCRMPTMATLCDALTDAGMAREHVDDYLAAQPTLRRFGDVWVRWVGSAGDKAETVLEVRNAPATADEIAAMIADGHTLRTIREALSADDRFVRTGRLSWALRRWGLDEYGGIADEITSRLHAAGGTLGVDTLVDDLKGQFPDLAEGSIRAFLRTPTFVTEAGAVRIRTEADGWPPAGPLNTARGVFRDGDNKIRLEIPVTSELLRGSGRTVHPAAATALGVEPAGTRTFSCPIGDVTITWRPSSTNGPNTSSLRAHATAVDARSGDSLILGVDLRTAALEVTRIDTRATSKHRLSQLLGRDIADPRRDVAAALDCSPADVEQVLRARGDHDLADMVVRR
jgi:hypothetical protein